MCTCAKFRSRQRVQNCSFSHEGEYVIVHVYQVSIVKKIISTAILARNKLIYIICSHKLNFNITNLSFRRQRLYHWAIATVIRWFLKVQSNLDNSNSDSSNSAKFEASIWIKNTFQLLSSTLIWILGLFV